MSTATDRPGRISYDDRCSILRQFVHRLGDVSSLLRPERLAQRLGALDELDLIMSDLDFEELAACSDPDLVTYTKALKADFEAANERIYAAARSAIALRKDTFALQRLLLGSSLDRVRQLPRPGLGFDLQDEIVNGILQLREPYEIALAESPEMVPYQPTPARHILDLIAASGLSREDTLVDLGSGLGHVPLLASILTGSRALGIEYQPGYVASALESARILNMTRVRFVAADARDAAFSTGTVFYMFSPFTGSMLTEVLNRLLKESRDRQIRICSLGPCTRILQNQVWLTSGRPPDNERITVFRSA